MNSELNGINIKIKGIWCQFRKNKEYKGEFNSKIIVSEMQRLSNEIPFDQIFVYKISGNVVGIFKFGNERTKHQELDEIVKAVLTYDAWLKKDMQEKMMMFS